MKQAELKPALYAVRRYKSGFYATRRLQYEVAGSVRHVVPLGTAPIPLRVSALSLGATDSCHALLGRAGAILGSRASRYTKDKSQMLTFRIVLPK
jgi:hypothetical protein